MTNEEIKMFEMLQETVNNLTTRTETALKELDIKQDLKLDTVHQRITALGSQMEANYQMQKLLSDTDRKVLLETRDNTRLTNGRVTKLENQSKDHYSNCPRVKDITDVKNEIKSFKDEMKDVGFLQRHPVLFMLLILAIAIVAFYFKNVII